MSLEVAWFHIGDADIAQIVDAHLSFAAPQVFPGRTDADYEALGTTAPDRLISMPVLIYAVTIAGRTTLIDAGVGDPPTAGEQPGHLLAGLRSIGIEPGQIDTVVYTHLHPDHIGGGVDADGRPTFPNARHVANASEWKFWMSRGWRRPPWEWLGASFERCLDPIERAGLVDLIEDGDTIAPGIRATAIPGHTPGQIGVHVETGDGAVLFIGDALHHPAQWTHPDWSWRDDADPLEASAQRSRLARELADTATTIASAHFPLPGVGHVSNTDAGARWRNLP